MLRRTILALSVTATLAMPAQAQGYSDSQRNVMEHFAQALAGTQVCTRYVVNERMMTLISIRFNVTFTNPAVMKHVEERAIFHRKRIEGRTADDICGALLRLFGPDGSNAKGLIAAAK